jgi:hypothetical protein
LVQAISQHHPIVELPMLPGLLDQNPQLEAHQRQSQLYLFFRTAPLFRGLLFEQWRS